MPHRERCQGGHSAPFSLRKLRWWGSVVRDAQADAVVGYELAMERLEHVRAEWVDRGRPLTVEHHNGVSSPDPLWKVLQDAEAFALRARAALRVRDRKGRPAGASSAPDRGAKLRAVS